MEREIKPNTKWLHFKGNHYVVITLAKHTETGEMMVIYCGIEKPGIYARPLAMFLSEVDHVKYPNVTQKYRFEEIKD